MAKKSGDGAMIVLLIGAIFGFLWSLFKYPIPTLIGINILTLIFYPNGFGVVFISSILIFLIYYLIKHPDNKIAKKAEEKSVIFSDKSADNSLDLFERNREIIEKHRNKISTSSSRYPYYYIDNMTRDCINDICQAEGKNNISPNHAYLSSWKTNAPRDWKDLANNIEQIFTNRQKELKEIEKEQEEIKRKERITNLSNNYANVISQFNDIAYRKVTTVDDYGEENWEALEKEAVLLIDKIAKKEGKNDNDLKSWKKYSWNMPDEYKKVKDNLMTGFKIYYDVRKNKPIENDNTSDMSGIEFENHLAQLLKSNGFDSVSGTPKTGDQGADLIAKKDGKTIVIQAKRYEGTVGNKAVQEVVGAINFYNGDEGWVITNSAFTKSARELARKSGVKLIDGTDMQQFSDTLKRI